MGVFVVFFGRRGVVGFNGCCSGASIGDGCFMLACISGRSGGGCIVATSPRPVREKVRPAWPGGGCEREKVLPAHEKCPKIGGLWRAGRVFSRKHLSRGCAGRTFSRKCRWRGRAGRTFSRICPRGSVAGRILLWGPVPAGVPRGLAVPSRPDGPAVPSAPAGISPGAPRAPGAWPARRKAASRRSGSSAPPTRRPSRSSGTWARSRGR